jgi:hypothetical protein
MIIETIKIEIITNGDKEYNLTELCQDCGRTIDPIKQGNGVSYYYTVNDRAISPSCLGDWLGKIGQGIANDPHPRWLHAMINK